MSDQKLALLGHFDLANEKCFFPLCLHPITSHAGLQGKNTLKKLFHNNRNPSEYQHKYLWVCVFASEGES